MLGQMNLPEDEESPGQLVTLGPDDVRQARRLLELLVAHDNREMEANATASAAKASREHLFAVARFSWLVRQGRVRHFSPAMFGEPAWDLLLALYVNESKDPTPTVSSLAKTAGASMTTAFRWIDYLEEKGLIERERRSLEGRAWTVALSERGRVTLEKYFTDVFVRMTASQEQLAGNASS